MLKLQKGILKGECTNSNSVGYTEMYFYVMASIKSVFPYSVLECKMKAMFLKIKSMNMKYLEKTAVTSVFCVKII